METTQCNAMMAQREITVTYTVEEAIKIAEVFDMMVDSLKRYAPKNDVTKNLILDALDVNVLIGQIRSLVFSVILNE